MATTCPRSARGIRRGAGIKVDDVDAEPLEDLVAATGT